MDEPESALKLIVEALGQFLSELSWTAVATLILATCFLTRFFSGINSHFAGRSHGLKSWTPRSIPHWLPFIGQGFSFGLYRQSLLEKARFV